MVVSIITIISIEKISLETIPIDLPIAAKIRATSPLGTIPQPMIALLTRPATKPAAILPTKATKAITKASSRTGRFHKVSSRTSMPVNTKNMGTKK